MRYISDQEYKRKMTKVFLRNKNIRRRKNIQKAKLSMFPKIKKPSTSKVILFCSMLLCLEIVIFCEYIMFTTGDTSSLYVLIGIPATLIPIIWSYYSKSKAENTKGGITYESVMMDKENENNKPVG